MLEFVETDRSRKKEQPILSFLAPAASQDDHDDYESDDDVRIGGKDKTKSIFPSPSLCFRRSISPNSTRRLSSRSDVREDRKILMRAFWRERPRRWSCERQMLLLPSTTYIRWLNKRKGLRLTVHPSGRHHHRLHRLVEVHRQCWRIAWQ